MQNQYVPPVFGETKFNCPRCEAFAHQQWYQICKENNAIVLLNGLNRAKWDEHVLKVNGFKADNHHEAISICYQCKQHSIWVKGKLVYPLSIKAPLPNTDMPDDVKKIYEEAREVSTLSPMASAALLRLALEKLLPQIGAKPAGIDKMIAELVAKGLSKEIEKALDIVRVIGNEAVHPGTIDLNDNSDIAFALFKLLNMIVERTITEKKEINEIYSLLPEGKLKGIEDRNARILNRQG